MNASEGTRFHGIYPSLVCPFRSDFEIDEQALAREAARLAAEPGLRGVLCNGHAGECAVLTREEKRRVVSVVREAIGAERLLVAGVSAEESREAAKEAGDAAAEGADAVMVMAPFSWALGQDAGMAVRHHRMIGEAALLPMVLFQGSVRAGLLAYPAQTLEALARLSGVVAVKEGSWETGAYEATRRLVRAAAPKVAVMASGDEHLFSCFVLGSEGSLVSLATLLPGPIVALDLAVRRGDLAAARARHEEIYRLARAIYGGPEGYRSVARLKAALHLAGRLPNALVRPPAGAVGLEELEEIGRLMSAAGISAFA